PVDVDGTPLGLGALDPAPEVLGRLLDRVPLLAFELFVVLVHLPRAAGLLVALTEEPHRTSPPWRHPSRLRPRPRRRRRALQPRSRVLLGGGGDLGCGRSWGGTPGGAGCGRGEGANGGP